MSSSQEPDLEALESVLGYRFNDRLLLLTAVTHPSYRYEHREVADDSQRLEFLGDAVLGLLTAEYVYRLHADSDEGLLTVLRSRSTSGRALAQVARALNLGAFLRLGRGENSPRMRQHGRTLADAMESVIGAAWLDGGYAAAAALFGRAFEPLLRGLSRDLWADNPKGELQVFAQRRFQTLPLYRGAPPTGPDHAPCHRVTVELGGECAAGEGGNKQEAESAAARALLARFKGSAGGRE